MPNKTIYIKDSDLEIWNAAQQNLGGESISSIIIECLKERLRGGKKMGTTDAIRAVLDELNEVNSTFFELHPAFSPEIPDANSLDLGYKVHEKNARPDRVLSLIVDPWNFEAGGWLNAAARSKIKSGIMGFWDGKKTDLHSVLRIGNMDILSRLLNLVGKRGLLKVAHAGELEFTILAVHPASGLPAKGDDNEMEQAINRSEFTVQFDEGTLVEGSNRKVVAGTYFSLIRGGY